MQLLPPQLVVLLLALSVAVGLIVPGAGPLDGPVGVIVRGAGVALAVAGLALTMTSARRFAQEGTNIVTFDDPDRLVHSGAFRHTRNPMYLGFLLLLAGAALAIGTATAWLGPVGFFLAAQFWYIPFEERRMAATFGPAYDDYRRRVPRWLGPPRVSG